MDGLHFPDLTIQGFRGIKDISISNLGRVTLITGKNNTGKSSVLEALRLHAYSAAPQIVVEILRFREEATWRGDVAEDFPTAEGAFQISALFHGFPRLSDDFGPIVVSTSGRARPQQLTMRVDWLTYSPDADGSRSFVHRQNTLFTDHDYLAALAVETEESERHFRLDRFLSRPRFERDPKKARMPCILVGPYSGERTGMLDDLWSEIVLTDRQKYVEEALRIIDPRISAVSIVASRANPGARTAIVRAEHIQRPVPLRSFGDGVNRLFAMALALVNARGGVLLIDEFENGLHHTAQLDAWRIVFRLARELDIQVFATSHSWDAVESFQRAAAESPEEGTLLRLIRRDDDVIPTVFAQEELEVATRARIEVR